MWAARKGRLLLKQVALPKQQFHHHQCSQHRPFSSSSNSRSSLLRASHDHVSRLTFVQGKGFLTPLSLVRPFHYSSSHGPPLAHTVVGKKDNDEEQDPPAETQPQNDNTDKSHQPKIGPEANMIFIDSIQGSDVTGDGSPGAPFRTYDGYQRFTNNTGTQTVQEPTLTQTATNTTHKQEHENDSEVAVKPEVVQPDTWFQRNLGPKSAEGSLEINRWKMTAPAFMNHLCIGSPWAWSIFADPLQYEYGFFSQTSMDWSLSQTTVPLSLVFALQGIVAAVAGTWQTRVGPRLSLVTAGVFFGGGMMVGGLGIFTHQLWLLYLGYGILSGIGVGLGYTPPIQALIQWFPDRKGLASGITIAGFGSGALAITPVANYLQRKFSSAPSYVGTEEYLDVIQKTNGMFVDIDGTQHQVVNATFEDLANSNLPDLAEGLYLVGSGSSGIAATMATVGAIYLGVMITSAFALKTPPTGYLPPGYVPPTTSATGSMDNNVPVNAATKSPQMAMIWSTFFGIAAGGVGLFGIAKPLLLESFSVTAPDLITLSFTSGFVMLLSFGNLSGRLAISALFDKLGPRKTFNILTWGSVGAYACLPLLLYSLTITESHLPIYGFMGVCTAAVSLMGGVYATLPALEATIFGSKYVGAIHGRVMLASSAAAVFGPNVFLQLREHSVRSSIQDLAEQVDPTLFQEKFHFPPSHAIELYESNQLSISKLMEVMPPGVDDPSPYLNTSSLAGMIGLASCAALSHYLLTPVNPALYEKVKKPRRKITNMM